MNIFYSWQSWKDTRNNRYFIEEAIKKAIKQLKREDQLDQREFEFDQATSGMTGSPDIADVVFRKIRESDLFVGDITPVAGGDGHKVPNPNVLIELGYAASELGWERVICVANTAYGRVEELPFDIRQHRITLYELKPNDEKAKRDAQMKRLSDAIVMTLQTVEHYSSPEREYLDQLILEYIAQFRVTIPLVVWMLASIVSNSKEEEILKKMLEILVRDLDRISGELPKLTVMHFNVLSYRQIKRWRRMTKVTKKMGALGSLYFNAQPGVNKNLLPSDVENLKPEAEPYLSNTISIIKALYDNEWLSAFNELVDGHILTPDDFLYDRSSPPSSMDQQMRMALYESVAWDSREQFEDYNQALLEHSRRWSAFSSIHVAYREGNLANRIWEVICDIKGVNAWVPHPVSDLPFPE